MKLTQIQIDAIKKAWGDWEEVHGIYDNFIFDRLKELDPEFAADIERVTKGATFWYA